MHVITGIDGTHFVIARQSLFHKEQPKGIADDSPIIFYRWRHLGDDLPIAYQAWEHGLIRSVESYAIIAPPSKGHDVQVEWSISDDPVSGDWQACSFIAVASPVIRLRVSLKLDGLEYPLHPEPLQLIVRMKNKSTMCFTSKRELPLKHGDEVRAGFTISPVMAWYLNRGEFDQLPGLPIAVEEVSDFVYEAEKNLRPYKKFEPSCHAVIVSKAKVTNE